MPKSHSPIILFAFNRPDHTLRTLESLVRNKLANESTLIVYADGPKFESSDETLRRIENTRQIIRSNKWCKHVILHESNENKGLAKSVIQGVSEVLSNNDSAIVLEDDLELSSNFLVYMNEALLTYRYEESIFSVSGYRYPLLKEVDFKEDVFLFPRASTWGWGTWKDRWFKAEWDLNPTDRIVSDKETQKQFNRGGDDMSGMLIDSIIGKNQSWGIKWCYSHFKNNAYGLFPRYSLLKNIGIDGSGEHCKPSDIDFGIIEGEDKEFSFPKMLSPNASIINSLRLFFSQEEPAPIKYSLKFFFQRIKRRLLRTFA